MKKMFEGLPTNWRRTNADKARQIKAFVRPNLVEGPNPEAIKGLLERIAKNLEGAKTQKA